MKNNIFGVIILAVFGIMVLRMPVPSPQYRAGLIAPQEPVKLVFPRGGETFAFGDRMDIRWEHGASDMPITLALTNEQGNELYRTLVTGSPNDGEEVWYVDMPPGQYVLALGTEHSRSFTIIEGPTTQLPSEAMGLPANMSLVLFYPFGGETFHTGSVETIRWYGGDASWNFTLRLLSGSDLSLQQVIGDNIPNMHWYAWMVPSVISGSTYYLELLCANCPESSGTRVLSRYPITIKNP